MPVYSLHPLVSWDTYCRLLEFSLISLGTPPPANPPLPLLSILREPGSFKGPDITITLLPYGNINVEVFILVEAGNYLALPSTAHCLLSPRGPRLMFRDQESCCSAGGVWSEISWRVYAIWLLYLISKDTVLLLWFSMVISWRIETYFSSKTSITVHLCILK